MNKAEYKAQRLIQLEKIDKALESCKVCSTYQYNNTQVCKGCNIYETIRHSGNALIELTKGRREMKQMVNKSPILIEKIKDLEAMITPEEMAKLRETYSVPEISEMLNAKKKTVDNFLTKYSLRKPYKVTAANEIVQLAEKAPAKEKEPIVKLKPEYAAIVKERDNALAALSEARKELDEVKQAYYAECDKNSLLNNLLNEMEERLSTKASETVVVNDTQYENELRFADVYETQLLKRILQLKGETV